VNSDDQEYVFHFNHYRLVSWSTSQVLASLSRKVNTIIYTVFEDEGLDQALPSVIRTVHPTT
jgi:hypothetical protein